MQQNPLSNNMEKAPFLSNYTVPVTAGPPIYMHLVHTLYNMSNEDYVGLTVLQEKVEIIIN